MSLAGGELRGPNGQTGTVIGGFADVTHINPATTGQSPCAQPVALQPRDVGGTTGATAQAGGPTSPAQLLDFTEFDPLKAKRGTGAKDRPSENLATSHEVPQNGTSFTPSTGDMASPADEVRRLELTPLPNPGRKEQHKPLKAKGKRQCQWRGEVYGEMHADKDALADILQRVIKVEERVLKENLAELEEEDEISEEDETDSVDGRENRPDTKVVGMKLRSQKTVPHMDKTEQKQVTRKQQSMFKDNGKYDLLGAKPKEVHFKNSSGYSEFEMPLMIGPKQEPVYHAYKIRDLEALVKQLPPITEGGAAWLRKLRTLTEGEDLAIGDFLAIAGRCMIGGGLADVEEIAKTTANPNDMPYNRVEDKLADAVREKYMTPNLGSIPKISWDPKYTPREFLERAKEQWMSQTGIHPGQEGEHRAWFRAAVLKGLLDKITTDLEKNPDFAVADSTQWERHVVHRLQLEQDEANKQKKELEDTQAQLLKLQLNEARKKHNSKKKEKLSKETKEANKPMMIVKPLADPKPDWPDLEPNFYPDDRKPPRQRRPAGNWETIAHKEGMVDPGGETLGLVVRGILEPIHGMSATNVEKKGTGLDIAVSCPQALNGETTYTRHVEVQEAEVATVKDIKLLTQAPRHTPNIQWLTGAGTTSIDGAHRDRTAGG